MAELHRATEAILERPDFAYLRNQFNERNNPSASRLSYAVQAEEDAILQTMIDHFSAKFRNVEFNWFLFDGLCVRFSGQDPSLPEVEMLLSEIENLLAPHVILKIL